MLRQLSVAVQALNKMAEANSLTAKANQSSDEAGEVVNLMAVMALENTLAEATLRAEEAQRDADEKTELYSLYALDVTDRFCHCLRLGFIDEAIYKEDYRIKIDRMIANNPTRWNEAFRYIHLQSVIFAWRAGNNATDRKNKRRSQTLTP